MSAMACNRWAVLSETDEDPDWARAAPEPPGDVDAVDLEPEQPDEVGAVDPAPEGAGDILEVPIAGEESVAKDRRLVDTKGTTIVVRSVAHQDAVFFTPLRPPEAVQDLLEPVQVRLRTSSTIG